MAIQYYMVQGDEEPVIRLRVDDGASSPLAIDLSDISTTVLEHSQDGTTWTQISGGGSCEQGGVADVDGDGTRYWYARYDWEADDTDSLSGGYLVRLRLTRASGNTLSVPSAPPWVQLIVSP